MTLSEVTEQNKLNNIWTDTEDQDWDFVDTEWTNLPEIIVDPNVDIPEPDIEPEEKDIIQDENKELIDEIEEIQDSTSNAEEKLEIAEIQNQFPEAMNLAIPFYAQAPDGDRSLPWKEACEESSLSLAAAYLQERELSKDEFKKEVLEMVTVQERIFWDYIDTNMEQTQQLFEEYYWFGKTKLIDNPTLAQLEAELAQGHPIIAPFAWKLLWNSNFTDWWPRYHVLVIRWYDDTYFYTNDVGTKRGENFPYTHETIMNALHDLVRENEWDITDWKKRILVLSP